MQWNSEWVLFASTWLASALTALAPILLSETPKNRITFSKLLGTMIMYGGLGSGFGMVIVYEYLGGKTAPWKVICGGMAVGAGAVKKADITKMFRRALGIPDDPKPTPRHRATEEKKPDEHDV